MGDPLPKFEIGDRVVPRGEAIDGANPMQTFRVQARAFKQIYEGSTLTIQGWMYFLLNEHTRYLASTAVGEDLLQRAPSKGWDQEEIS